MKINVSVTTTTTAVKQLRIIRWVEIPKWTIGGACCAVCGYQIEDNNILVADLEGEGRRYFHFNCFQDRIIP